MLRRGVGVVCVFVSGLLIGGPVQDIPASLPLEVQEQWGMLICMFILAFALLLSLVGAALVRTGDC